MKPLFLAVGLAVLAASLAHAQEANLEALASDLQWQALLHVNRGTTLHSRGESYVDDPAFFLSDDGKSDAAAELVATVQALAEAKAPARCRFPARYNFLAERLGWNEADPLAHCSEYLEWRATVPSGRVVLVFPASYLNSPSSMFGHTLLRFDHSNDPDSVWNSWAVNFGAMMSGRDNSLLYIYRGLLGGYPGRFAIVPYVTKIQEYSHMENRDMWEYTLSFSPEEVDRLVTHLWELRDISFDYYFFDENCSYRLLELVDVARPGTGVLADFRLAEAPVNTVRAMDEAGLVSAREYRPSKAVELQHHARQLSGDERGLVKDLIERPEVGSSERFRRHPPERQHLMARTAYEVIRFTHRKRERDPEVAARSLGLLRVVSTTPAPPLEPPEQPAPPEAGHGTQTLTLAAGRFGEEEIGEIGYRFTYHDLVDNDLGFLRGAQIEGIDLRLRSTDSDDLKLETLDIVHIRSLAPWTSFLKPVSWFVHGGLERAVADDRRRLVRFVQGGPGITTRLGPVMPYGFAVLRLENNSAYNAVLEGGTGARLGALAHLGGMQFDLGAEGIYFGNDEYRHYWNFDANLPLGRQDALRLELWREAWRGEGENGVTLAWRHYFD